MFERYVNAPTFSSVEEFNAEKFNYPSRGSVPLVNLEQILVQDIVGGKVANDHEVQAICFGPLGRVGLISLFTAFGAGRQIVSTPKIFGGTYVYLTTRFSKHTGGKVVMVENINNIGALRGAIESGDTAMVFFETISNPLLRPANLTAIISAVKKYYPQVLVVVDETMTAGLPTLLGHPFSALYWGADAIFVSMTKYVTGDDKARGGVIIARKEIVDVLLGDRMICGNMLEPEDAEYILKRNSALRENEVRPNFLRERLVRASAQAAILAGAIQEAEADVLYPGLKSDPDHWILGSQGLGDFGGILSVNCGSIEGARKIINALAEHPGFRVANSFGSQETRIEPIYDGSPAFAHPILRDQMGIPEGLIRISCGYAWAPDLLKSMIEHAKKVFYGS